MVCSSTQGPARTQSRRGPVRAIAACGSQRDAVSRRRAGAKNATTHRSAAKSFTPASFLVDAIHVTTLAAARQAACECGAGAEDIPCSGNGDTLHRRGGLRKALGGALSSAGRRHVWRSICPCSGHRQGCRGTRVPEVDLAAGTYAAWRRRGATGTCAGGAVATRTADCKKRKKTPPAICPRHLRLRVVRGWTYLSERA